MNPDAQPVTSHDQTATRPQWIIPKHHDWTTLKLLLDSEPVWTSWCCLDQYGPVGTQFRWLKPSWYPVKTRLNSQFEPFWTSWNPFKPVENSFVPIKSSWNPVKTCPHQLKPSWNHNPVVLTSRTWTALDAQRFVWHCDYFTSESDFLKWSCWESTLMLDLRTTVDTQLLLRRTEEALNEQNQLLKLRALLVTSLGNTSLWNTSQ